MSSVASDRRASAEYHTATEDEGDATEDEAPASKNRDNNGLKPGLNHVETDDTVTKRQANELRNQLDLGMATVMRKAQELAIKK